MELVLIFVKLALPQIVRNAQLILIFVLNVKIRIIILRMEYVDLPALMVYHVNNFKLYLNVIYRI